MPLDRLWPSYAFLAFAVEVSGSTDPRKDLRVTEFNRVVLYDPAISSLNLGDEIISDSARRQLAPLLDQAYVVDVSTHMPASHYLRLVKDADHRFVLGSNLLRGRMNGLFRQWDIHALNAWWVGPAVLMGVGWWQYGDEPNRYTKSLYRRVLSSERVHSVRDSYTERMMHAMGWSNVVMTGCPTMWDLTPEHCARISATQGAQVVTTLTDYNKDPASDLQLLALLRRHYDKVHFWVQGYKDLDYIRSLADSLSGIQIIPPKLSALDAVLDQPNIDYVGTRLHAGIRALQRQRRALILSIDNRAQEKSKDFGIAVAPRGDARQIADWITGNRPTSIALPQRQISEWKSQFGISS